MHASILTVFRQKQLILQQGKHPVSRTFLKLSALSMPVPGLFNVLTKKRLIKSTAVYFETDSWEGTG